MGLVVFKAGRSSRVHASPDCPPLVQKAKIVLEWDLDQVPKARFCKICFPDAPVHKSRRTRCCGTITRACQHNGGVLVLFPGSPSHLGWVWPEDAHRHTLVNPVPLG